MVRSKADYRQIYLCWSQKVYRYKENIVLGGFLLEVTCQIKCLYRVSSVRHEKHNRMRLFSPVMLLL